MTNVVLDLYSITICLILFIYLASGNRKHNKLNRYFRNMCAANIIMLLGDMTNWLCEGTSNSWFPVLLRSGTAVYYLSAVLLVYFFACYITEYMSVRTKVSLLFKKTVLALGFFYSIGVILSLRKGLFFSISEENIYQRGEWYWLSQAIPLLVYLLACLFIFIYRRQFSKREKWIFSSYILFPVIAEGIQICFYGVALLNTAITVSLLVIFINIQLQRELLMEHQETELAKMRINIMLSQIQPHFLYNTLTTIRQLCDLDPMQAKQAIRDFAWFLRSNMDSLTNKERIPFEQELQHTKSYVNLELQRFRERLKVNYDIQSYDFTIPPLTLQPIVENAIRHGVMKREEGGTITIRTEEDEIEYRIFVYDDGIGFQVKESGEGIKRDRPEEKCHIGTENVRKRLQAMCNGTLEIYSRPGEGTTALIRIPRRDRNDNHCG